VEAAIASHVAVLEKSALGGENKPEEIGWGFVESVVRRPIWRRMMSTVSARVPAAGMSCTGQEG